MIAVLALSLMALFAALMILEIAQHESAIETAESARTLERIRSIYSVLQRIDGDEASAFLGVVSSCHAGYTITQTPFRHDATAAQTQRLATRLAQSLSLDAREQLAVGFARLRRNDFSYAKCSDSEILLPMDGVVISLQLGPARWLNAEVHPHEPHVREKIGWMLRASAAFIFVGGVAILFMRRLSKPLNNLTAAAQKFGDGLQVSELKEDGPADLQRAIRSFNTMQRQVADEIARRTSTLAAISHDVRTPLTALRVKAELIDDAHVRQDLIASINRMEAITASALEFLRGQSRNEPMRPVDLSALIESECQDFEEVGGHAAFVAEQPVQYTCRPDALARAVRNLIDNAIKHGGGAMVELRAGRNVIDISVADNGPGIPADQVERALEPFERLSAARESHQGGFGLGLAVAKAIAEGHEGELILSANVPTGLIATLRLPLAHA
jgi:signal transduction histidine kinase